jgi:asparagine synthase (glutamine-hydrolysing)
MTAALTHRGPDDEGYFEKRTDDGHFVGLGHRRLSIIDLASGHQPIGNEDGSVQIIFNGEIYNFQELREDLTKCGHRFTTHSDTEVIVHAFEEYGEDCVEFLRGMFAFAIWDANSQKLFLARDRFGQKPLFLYESDGLLLFASEIKALAAWPGIHFDVDQNSILDYLTYRYVPGPDTLFAGVRKLQPGTRAIWHDGELTEERYFQPADRKPRSTPVLPDQPVERFLEELDEAVGIRMVADVPYGAFLSGGIDSSAIVALMARHSSLPVKTFSVGFSETAYSELDYARVIAKQFGTDHHELTVSSDRLIDELPALIRFRDAPVSEPSDIPIYLLAKEARRTVKMVLTGEGSDEFLGGYQKHIYERFVSAYQKTPKLIRRSLVEPLVHSLPYRFRSVKTGVINLGIEDWFERMPRWFGSLSSAEREELVAFELHHENRVGRSQFDIAPGNSALRNILYFDQVSWLPDNLLERGDRMTMAASLEARMPFMDHKLAAFISMLPDNYRIRGSQTKWILRQALKIILPAKIINRPKIGFRLPVNEWFRGPMRDYLYDHLTGPHSQTRQYYHPKILDRLLDEHVRGRQNHEKLLWTLLNLEIWHRLKDGVSA